MNEKTISQTMLDHISTATGLINAKALQRRLNASGKTYLIVLNDPEVETYFVATVAEACALTEAGYEVLSKSFVGTLSELLARLTEWGIKDVDLSGADRLCLDWRYAAEATPFDTKLLELSVLNHPDGGHVHLGHARLP